MRRILLLAALAWLSAFNSSYVLAQEQKRAPARDEAQRPAAAGEALSAETTVTKTETTTHLTRKAASPQETKLINRYRSREARLAAKPVDVNKTSGQPKAVPESSVSPE